MNSPMYKPWQIECDKFNDIVCGIMDFMKQPTPCLERVDAFSITLTDSYRRIGDLLEQEYGKGHPESALAFENITNTYSIIHFLLIQICEGNRLPR